MRRLVLAMAMLGGLGCGGEEPELLCTATAGPELRMSSLMDERGLPVATWRWDARGLRAHSTYRYDDAGRLVEERFDLGMSALEDPDGEEPDGKVDAVRSITYRGATAVVTITRFGVGDDPAVTYELDDAGRPLRIFKDQFMVDEIHEIEYDADGRVRIADELGLPNLPHARRTEYVYGAAGWPDSMRATLDGTAYDWRFEYEEAPGRALVRGIVEGQLETVHVYEHDGDGRLLRAEHPAAPERNLEITYAADGAVTALLGGRLPHTYSAGCGVTFEVPRGPAAPRGPGPEGYYVLPEIPAPWVMASLIPF